MLFNSLNDSKSLIESIIISNNCLDDNCIVSIGNYVQNNNMIKDLDIGRNNISDAGISMLEPYIIGGTKLEYLGFAGNKGITDKSFEELSKMLQSSLIEHINIGETSMSNQYALLALQIINKIKKEPLSLVLNSM